MPTSRTEENEYEITYWLTTKREETVTKRIKARNYHFEASAGMFFFQSRLAQAVYAIDRHQVVSIERVESPSADSE